MKPNIIIIRYSEIGLKAKFTRKIFENILRNNINDILKKENIIFNLYKTRGRFFIYTKEIKKTIKILKKIFGIKSISPCFQTNNNIDSMKKFVIKVTKDKINKEISFALRVKREGIHNYTSQDVAILLGNEIVKQTNAKVNLTYPDIELFIEIRQNNVFFFFEKFFGPGGLPLGSQGKVLSLVRSKDYRFLATWYMMRRGCIPVFLTLEKEVIKHIKNFANKWYYNVEIIYCKKSSLYKSINNIILDYGCEAVITDYFLSEDYSDILKEIRKLKNCIKVPILHPLIIMDEALIQEKNTEIDL